MNEFLVIETYKKYKILFEHFNIKPVFLENNIHRLILRRRLKNYDVIITEIHHLVFNDLDKHVKLYDRPYNNIDWSKYIIILDEIDYVCIDKYRIPFSIVNSNEQIPLNFDYKKAYNFTKSLVLNQDYKLFTKFQNIIPTSNLYQKFKKYYNMDERINLNNIFPYNNALCLSYIFILSVLQTKHFIKIYINYLIVNNTIQIIDQASGRVLPSNKYRYMIDLAIKMINNLPIDKDPHINVDYISSSSSLWRFLQSFNSVVGMSGTAYGVQQIMLCNFNTNVVNVFRNKINLRKDNDVIFINGKENKINTIVQKICKLHTRDIPILLCTPFIKEAIKIYKRLKFVHKLSCNILLPINLDQEKELISNAGSAGKILISTNISGRGTDIIVGGNMFYAWEKINSMTNLNRPQKIKIFLWVKKQILNNAYYIRKKGGICVIKTSFNIDERIDLQVLGRAGRQGEPGFSLSYSSKEDILWKNLKLIVPTDRFLKLYDHTPASILVLKCMVPILQSYLSKYVYMGNQMLTLKSLYYNYHLKKILKIINNITNTSNEDIYYELLLLFFKTLDKKYIKNIDVIYRYKNNIEMLIQNIEFTYLDETNTILLFKHFPFTSTFIINKTLSHYKSLDKKTVIIQLEKLYVNIEIILKNLYDYNEFKFVLSSVYRNEKLYRLSKDVNSIITFELLRTIQKILI